MADKPQTRYIDADKLISIIYGTIPHVNTPYTSDPVSQAIATTISQNINVAFSQFASNLHSAIEAAARPYENEKCMLCKQRDWDFVPDHPLGENR